MSRIIGYVKSVENGTFFSKDAEGHIRQLKVGDVISEGEIVYGDNANVKNAKIIVDMANDGVADLTLAGNEALNFDTSLLKNIFSADDAIIHTDSLKSALNAIDPALLEDKDLEEETAAGEVVLSENSTSVVFADRDGLIKDVRTVLDFTSVASNQTTVTIDAFRPVILDVLNDPTVVVNDIATTNEDVSINIDVLANDTDIDSAKSPVASVTQGANGTVEINLDGTVKYTPNANYNGTDSFTYTNAEGNTATVNVTVNPVNDAPISTNDAITILEDLNNTINVYTLSVNDFGTYSDVENHSLSSIRIDSLPANGTLYLNSIAVTVGAVIPVTSIIGGLLKFDPINHTDADSSFTFSVNDGNVWSTSSYTTTITITAVADTPTAMISATGVVTETIIVTNVSTTGNGFTVSALNPNGSVGTISTHTAPDGFGVTGVSSGDTSEIGYLDGTGSEKLVVKFDNDVTSVDVSFAWKHSNGTGETALVEFYNNGVLVGTRTYNGGSDLVDPAIALQPNGGGVFDEIRFAALGSGDDYLIHSISFDKIVNSTAVIMTNDNSSVDLDASSLLVDTDGSETLNTTISGLPVGYTLTDGTHTFTATAGSTVANVTGWNLAALSLGVPTVTAQTTVTLTITATATESSNGSNASASDSIDIIVVPHNDAPIFETTAITATVSEEGLAGGLADTTGTPVDTTNVTVSTGTFNITDIDSTSVSVSLFAPTTALTSNGVAITWSGSGTNALVGSAGGKEIINISINNTGAYAVTLKGAVDHATAGVEDIKSFNVNVTASDGSLTSTGTLTVAIEDDAPMASSQTYDISVAQQNTNMMIILDVSGSMTDNNGTSGIQASDIDRLAAAKTAITNLIQTYDGYGNVAVKIVTFSTLANDTSSVWMSATDAMALLNTISAGGYTNYDAALAEAMTSWNDAGKFLSAPAGGTLNNVAYFISDGQPNENDGNTLLLVNSSAGTLGGSDAGIQTAEEIIWETFLTNNQIKSYALGIGDGLTSADMAYLDPIAYDGSTATDSSSLAILVPNVANLTSVLQATVTPIASGNILAGATPGAVGADGGYVYSISVGPVGDVRTFTWDKTANTISATGTGGSTYVFNTTTHVLSVTTEQGGLYIVDLDSGDYNYSPPVSMAGTISEVFGFTLIDNDRDTASGQITMNITRDAGTTILIDTGVCAIDNNLAVAYGSTTTGNVMTNDALGTDSVTVTSVMYNGTSYTVGSAIDTGKGILTLNSNGTYTYDSKIESTYSGNITTTKINDQTVWKANSSATLFGFSETQFTTNLDEIGANIVTAYNAIPVASHAVVGYTSNGGLYVNSGTGQGDKINSQNTTPEALIINLGTGVDKLSAQIYSGTNNPETLNWAVYDSNGNFLGKGSSTNGLGYSIIADIGSTIATPFQYIAFYGTWSNGGIQFNVTGLTSVTYDASASVTEDFTYTITDADGDVSQADLSVTTGTADAAITWTGTAGNDTYTGKEGNDTLSGAGGNDVIRGGSGSDTIDGGAGSDSLYGDAGADTLIFDAVDAVIDGGTGTDIMILNTGVNIDFSALGNVIKNIEVIDLSKNGAHTLDKLSVQDVLDMTTPQTHDLIILGGTDDMVNFQNTAGATWTKTAELETMKIGGVDHTFDVYVNSLDPTVSVKVEQAITDTI